MGGGLQNPSGESSVVIVSVPPNGKYKVTNIYVDPDTGRTVVEYDDTPAEEEE